MTKKKRIRRDPKAAHAYWLAKVTQFKSSGLTQKQFASLHGLSVYSLRDWLQRFKKLGIDIPTTVVGPIENPPLVRVRLVEKRQTPNLSVEGLRVEIKIPGGAVVTLSGITVDQSANLIRGLL